MRHTTKNKTAVKDVPADNPEGTLDRMAEALKRVIAVPKSAITKKGSAHQQRKELKT